MLFNRWGPAGRAGFRRRRNLSPGRLWSKRLGLRRASGSLAHVAKKAWKLTGDELHDYQANCAREWLLTNGLGGYASSTVIGANTRRYHGLLVAALRPPADRRVFLAKLEEEVIQEGTPRALSVNKYPGVLHPRGHELLESFTLRPRPKFRYRLPRGALDKEVSVVQGRNAALVRYTLHGTAARLILRPLVTGRDFHAETHEGAPWTFGQKSSPRGFVVEPFPSSPKLHVIVDEGSYRPDGLWYRNFVYDLEAERGLADREDLFSPGVFEVDLVPGSSIVLAAALEPDDPQALWSSPGRRARVHRPKSSDPFARALYEAARSFIVQRGAADSTAVIAGYHWFGEWGRDTMIALPGLCLLPGLFSEARSILRSFAARMNSGLIPNRFADSGNGAEYNSVDGSLWFVNAVAHYVKASGDWAFAGEIYPKLQEVFEYYNRGTLFGIHTGDDGLLEAGTADVEVTWMDAKVGDRVVTPRNGRAVEVNALWHNALATMAELSRHLGGANPYGDLARRVKGAFEVAFWAEDRGYLLDVVGPQGSDASLRPNQLLALSLPHPLLDPRRAARVLEAVERELLTPFGLRTLDPANPRYRGRYGGDQRTRDEAYHNGTVWPWLLGPYADAVALVRGRRAAAAVARRSREAFEPHLREAGLGSISEVFDGDPPHRPAGCISQAWSVAEILRIWIEYGGDGS